MSDRPPVYPTPSDTAGIIQKALTEIHQHLAGVPQVKADIAGCRNHLYRIDYFLGQLDLLQGTSEPVEQDSEENHTRQ